MRSASAWPREMWEPRDRGVPRRVEREPERLELALPQPDEVLRLRHGLRAYPVHARLEQEIDARLDGEKRQDRRRAHQEAQDPRRRAVVRRHVELVAAPEPAPDGARQRFLEVSADIEEGRRAGARR